MILKRFCYALLLLMICAVATQAQAPVLCVLMAGDFTKSIKRPADGAWTLYQDGTAEHVGYWVGSWAKDRQGILYVNTPSDGQLRLQFNGNQFIAYRKGLPHRWGYLQSGNRP